MEDNSYHILDPASSNIEPMIEGITFDPDIDFTTDESMSAVPPPPKKVDSFFKHKRNGSMVGALAISDEAVYDKLQQEMQQKVEQRQVRRASMQKIIDDGGSEEIKSLATESSNTTSSTKSFYTFNELKTRSAEERISNPYPSNIDTRNRELYLSDADFMSIFKMTKDEFSKVPAWRKQELKKRAKLF
jgi:hypothetical protein